jgi:hypothetical protein
MEFAVELATAKDDLAIRRLLASNPVPGRVVTVTFEREPNYFLGCSTIGRFCQVLVARHQPSGEIVGVACRSTRPLFVNGQVEEVGYLGQLRVGERFRGRWMVSEGFRFLHGLHADGRVPGYVTTIIEGNDQAQGILVDRARRHFPVYREVDRLCTMAILLRAPKRPLVSPYEISRGSATDLNMIVTFLKQQGAAKQFSPVYAMNDFGGNPATLGFQVEDFIVARCNGKLVGVIGLWDQSSYKQTVVRAYNDSLGWLRPLYNVAARLAGTQPLPLPGEPIRSAYASFIFIAENNLEIFRVLLRHIYNLAAERRYATLMVGLSVRDPLLSLARQYAHISYYSRLFTVCWKEEEDFHKRLDARVPYIEIAAL